MMGQNPYYDESDGEGSTGGGGGNIDLSDYAKKTDLNIYAKKTEVKTYDEVKPKASDSKETNVIYIDSQGILWTYDGTNYNKVSPDTDITNIPINRLNITENVKPQQSELRGITPYKNTLATVYLASGVIEVYKYARNTWRKEIRMNRQPRVFTVLRESPIENVQPTTSEIYDNAPIKNDKAYVSHYENSKLIFIERWDYNSSWVRVNKVLHAYKVLQVKNQPYAITPDSEYNTFFISTSRQQVILTLPNADEVEGRTFTFKRDGSGEIVTIKPNGDKINNVVEDLVLGGTKDHVTIVSDGDEWHITNDGRIKPRKPMHVVIHRENNIRGVKPLPTDFDGEQFIVDDEATVILQINNTLMGMEKWEYVDGTGWTKTDDVFKDGTYMSYQTIVASQTIENPDSFYIAKDATHNVDIRTTNWRNGNIATIKNITNDEIGILNNSGAIDMLEPDSTGVYMWDGTEMHIVSKTNSFGIDRYFCHKANPFNVDLHCVLYRYPTPTRLISRKPSDTSKRFLWNVDKTRFPRVAGGGIDGVSIPLVKGQKLYVQDNSGGNSVISGWNLSKRSFFISFWVNPTELDRFYFGQKNNGGKDQSLHIGWRDDNTFTVAFYANDCNWGSVGNKSDDMNSWTHYSVQYNYSNNTLQLIRNGVDMGILNVPNGLAFNMDLRLELFGGSRNSGEMSGRFSNVRFISKANGEIFTTENMTDLYKKEHKYLID